MGDLILLIVAGILVNNVVLSQFLGICPFLGVSRKIETATGMGLAVVFVITLSSAITNVIYNYLLVEAGLEYLQTIVFILVIAALVQLVEMVLKKYSTGLYESLGVYLTLITTNCAVLGVALINVQNSYGFVESVVNGFGTALGFLFAIVLMAGMRENSENNDVPKSLQGSPIVLVSSGLMAMAFYGFSGLL